MWCVMGMGQNVLCDGVEKMWCVMGWEKMWCVMGWEKMWCVMGMEENVVCDGGGRKCGV